MAIRNTLTHYGAGARFFHWASFFWIAGLTTVGFWMTRLPKEQKAMIYGWHKLGGLALLAFLILRLLWRFTNTNPELPSRTSRLIRILAAWSHSLLYLIMFIMPLSGWLMSTASGRSPHWADTVLAMPGIPESQVLAGLGHFIHINGIWVLLGLLTLHILAALKHRLINRDGVYQRMVFGKITHHLS